MTDFTFDGPNRRIYISTHSSENVITFHAKDIYIAWKDWCVNSDGLKYPPLFDVIGGIPISDTINTGSYFFMRTDYGWVGIPPEIDNIIITIRGNMYPKVVGARVLDPLPNFTTTLIMQNSSLTETVVINSGTGLTTEQDNKLTAAATESTKARQMQTNNAEVAEDGSQSVIYDDDGSTPLITFNHPTAKKRVKV